MTGDGTDRGPGGLAGLTGLTGETGDRLKEELKQYLEARAGQAVGGLGERLGEATQKLAAGGGGGSLASVALPMLTGGLKDKVTGALKGLGGKSGRGDSRGKRVVVIEGLDVGVPVRQAYDQWTRFQEFGRFAKGVVNVDQSDETTTNWQLKVAKSNRSYRATVMEQIPDERIVWTSEGGKGTTKGAVTFHPLGDNLTKVLLVMEYYPKGLVEKTGNLFRSQGRRARLDLKLYRTFVTMQDEPAEGWRGEIRDGEVVRGPDEEPEEGGESADGEDDGYEDGGEDGAYEEEGDDGREDDADEGEEYEDEYDDEPYPDEGGEKGERSAGRSRGADGPDGTEDEYDEYEEEDEEGEDEYDDEHPEDAEDDREEDSRAAARARTGRRS
ncbi:SRPBCC family protein [Streptomyces sp. LP05-1]|uniref:SRPBCC family protein n=1 Tax=Streptomyces pyxinae TaxID=2970734 RepID=A0ABT2CM68_9ACTN|nr:SRPBCC family protein [Streptomyces sp. LP05-1]MCS0638533.1 SRPBCC family protein [Streptomyces sp. LP05-1]